MPKRRCGGRGMRSSVARPQRSAAKMASPALWQGGAVLEGDILMLSRRDFVRLIGIGGATAPAVACGPAAPPTGAPTAASAAQKPAAAAPTQAAAPTTAATT